MDEKLAISKDIDQIAKVLGVKKNVSDFENGSIAALKAAASRSKVVGSPALSNIEQARQRQWLDLRISFTESQPIQPVLEKLHQCLRSRTFLVSDTVTLVDVVWAVAVAPHMVNMSYSDKEKYVNVTRWLTLLSSLFKKCQEFNIIRSKTILYSREG